LFRVHLPNDEGFVSVAFQNDLTLQKVYDNVCKKRDINAEDFHLEYDDEAIASKNPGPVSMDKTLGQLGVYSLKLVCHIKRTHQRQLSKGGLATSRGDTSSTNEVNSPRKSAALLKSTTLFKSKSSADLGGDASKQVTKRLGPVFFFTNQTAVKHQEYKVIKVNKFGVKQERVMGIDDKKITNSIPDDNNTKGTEKVKRPERGIEEVSKCWLGTGARNAQFFIEFQDQTYRYEAPQAEEIVAKINYLLKMQQEDRERVHRVNAV